LEPFEVRGRLTLALYLCAAKVQGVYPGDAAVAGHRVVPYTEQSQVIREVQGTVKVTEYR